MYDLYSCSEPQSHKVPTLGSILRCHHLGVLNDCEQEDTFSLCRRPCEFCNQFRTYCQSPMACSLLLPPVTDELLWLLKVTGGEPIPLGHLQSIKPGSFAVAWVTLSVLVYHL